MSDERTFAIADPVDASRSAPLPGRPWPRSLIVVIVTTAIIAVAVDVVLRIFLATIFAAVPGGPIGWYAIGCYAAAWTTACAITLTATRITGRVRWWGGILAPTLAGAVLVAYLVRGRGFPLDWFTSVPGLPGWQGFVIGAIAALAPGVFLPAWWARFSGTIAMLTISAFLLIPGIQQSWYAADDVDAARAQAEREAQERSEREAAFDRLLTDLVAPALPDPATVSIDDVRPGREFTTTFFVTSSGAAMTSIVDGTGTWESNEAYPCWVLADGTTTFPDSAPLADLADWCVRDETGWSRTDGTGAARVMDDRLVVVRVARDGEAVGSRAATPADVAEAAASVRTLDAAEFRAVARASYFIG